MPHPTTPFPILKPKQVSRFWSAVKRGLPTECWEWQGSRLQSGYGTVFFNGKAYKAHRIAWYLLNGDMPEGTYACHTCDNPACVNPHHIFPGTPKENRDDMVAKGRARAPHSGGETARKVWSRRAYGSKHHNAKLTEDQVREIRERFVRLSPYRTNARLLADEFGVGPSHIVALVEGGAWSRVT